MSQQDKSTRVYYSGRQIGKSHFAKMMGWRPPARIRRMSKRRQKKAIVRWMNDKIRRELAHFIGMPNTSEVRDDIMDAMMHALNYPLRRIQPMTTITLRVDEETAQVINAIQGSAE